MTPDNLNGQTQHDEVAEFVAALRSPRGVCASAKYIADLLEQQAARIAELEEDAEALEWLEQHAWLDELECFNFVDGWITPDGKRHSGGLRYAIAAMKAKP